jgi:hypothetical protein
MIPLEDAKYDILVVEASRDTLDTTVMHLELVITAGARKGFVVNVQASGLDRDEIEALGVPGVLTVERGSPSVTLE